MATRAGIPSGEHDVAGELMFDIEVELLHSPLLEVEILRLNSAGEIRRIGWRSKDWGECLRKSAARGDSSKRTEAGEISRFREEWWVLPQALCALVPGGIVEHRIAAANGGALAAERLPSEPDARFKSGFVQFDAGAAVGVLPGDQVVAARRASASAVEIKVRLAVLGLGDGCHEGLG